MLLHVSEKEPSVGKCNFTSLNEENICLDQFNKKNYIAFLVCKMKWLTPPARALLALIYPLEQCLIPLYPYNEIFVSWVDSCTL